MSDYLGMKKVGTKWILKFFTPLPHANRVDCCEELLEEYYQNPTGLFGHLVTGRRDMDTSLRATQPTRSKDLKETRQKDTKPTKNHTTG